jgi:hypothetical protein
MGLLGPLPGPGRTGKEPQNTPVRIFVLFKSLRRMSHSPLLSANFKEVFQPSLSVFTAIDRARSKSHTQNFGKNHLEINELPYCREKHPELAEKTEMKT